METEISNTNNSEINNINGSPKKRPHEDSEMNDNIKSENLTSEQNEFEDSKKTSSTTESNIKRPRSDLDNNSDSDFENVNENNKNNINEKEEEKDEIDETEQEKDHNYCLNRLYLKRLIRENHASPIRQIVFNHQPLPGSEFDAGNIVATVAKAGITVYDNEHCGNHFDIMAHFILNGQGYLPGPNGKVPTVEGQMNTMCWISKIDDAIIATAGADKDIHILSLAYTKEIALLSGHQDAVDDLLSYTLNNNIIISCSRDGTIRIWDIYKEKCLCVYKSKEILTVMTLSAKGDKIFVGTEAGLIIECIIPEWIYNKEVYDEEIKSVDFPRVYESDSSYQIIRNSKKKIHSTVIDSIGIINDNILSKDINGHIYLWKLETDEILKEYKHRNLLRQNRCRFGISMDNTILCVGTAFGTVLIFDLIKGNVISEIGHKRSSEPVKCSIFTRNCKSIIFGSENATIWRFDYVSKKQKKEWENWRHSHPELSKK